MTCPVEHIKWRTVVSRMVNTGSFYRVVFVVSSSSL